MNYLMEIGNFLYWLGYTLLCIVGLMVVIGVVILVGTVFGIVFNLLMDAIFDGVRWLDHKGYTHIEEDDEE